MKIKGENEKQEKSGWGNLVSRVNIENGFKLGFVLE
jgi:hypothetical protein